MNLNEITKSRNHSKTQEMPAGGEGEVTGVKKVM